MRPPFLSHFWPLFRQPYRTPTPAEARGMAPTPAGAVFPVFAYILMQTKKPLSLEHQRQRPKQHSAVPLRLPQKMRPLGVRRVLNSVRGTLPQCSSRKPVFTGPNAMHRPCNGAEPSLAYTGYAALGQGCSGKTFTRASRRLAPPGGSLCARQARYSIPSLHFPFYDIVNYYIHPPAVCQIFFENSANLRRIRQKSAVMTGATARCLTFRPGNVTMDTRRCAAWNLWNQKI